MITTQQLIGKMITQSANVIIFVLSFFLVLVGCYHLCYHLMLSFFNRENDNTVRKCYHVLSFFLVPVGCYHLCYHLTQISVNRFRSQWCSETYWQKEIYFSFMKLKDGFRIRTCYFNKYLNI
jgi:hypothetical protein